MESLTEALDPLERVKTNIISVVILTRKGVLMYASQVAVELCSPGKDDPASEAKSACGEDLSPRDLEGG